MSHRHNNYKQKQNYLHTHTNKSTKVSANLTHTHSCMHACIHLSLEQIQPSKKIAHRKLNKKMSSQQNVQKNVQQKVQQKRANETPQQRPTNGQPAHKKRSLPKQTSTPTQSINLAGKKLQTVMQIQQRILDNGIKSINVVTLDHDYGYSIVKFETSALQQAGYLLHILSLQDSTTDQMVQHCGGQDNWILFDEWMYEQGTVVSGPVTGVTVIRSLVE